MGEEEAARIAAEEEAARIAAAEEEAALIAMAEEVARWEEHWLTFLSDGVYILSAEGSASYEIGGEEFITAFVNIAHTSGDEEFMNKAEELRDANPTESTLGIEDREKIKECVLWDIAYRTPLTANYTNIIELVNTVLKKTNSEEVQPQSISEICGTKFKFRGKKCSKLEDALDKMIENNSDIQDECSRLQDLLKKKRLTTKNCNTLLNEMQ